MQQDNNEQVILEPKLIAKQYIRSNPFLENNFLCSNFLFWKQGVSLSKRARDLCFCIVALMTAFGIRIHLYNTSLFKGYVAKHQTWRFYRKITFLKNIHWVKLIERYNTENAHFNIQPLG